MGIKINLRLKILKYTLIFFSCVIVWKLFNIQIIKGKEYRRLANAQHQKQITIPAKRGNIYDRQKRIIAQDLEYYSFGCFPGKVKNPDKVANIFAKHLKKNRNTYLKKIKKNGKFVWLERKVEKKIGDEIWKNKLSGVTRTADYSRFYSYSNTASQIVGFTDIDNLGLTGIEKQYNNLLQGKDGNTILKVDAIGQIFPDPGLFNNPPKKGANIILTLDIILQTIAEEELKNAVQKSKAKSGMVVIMNPKTGEILAMASYPDYNPNIPSKYKNYNYKNRVIADTFEPGSTFKVITASAVLEENIKKPDDIIFCENGRYRIHRHTIRDVKPNGKLTFKQIIEKSSNIGIAKIAALLGRNNLYTYARDFGFGNKTGLGLIGEARGNLKKPPEWSKLTLPEIAFGQEISVTAIQLISAFSAIANNGILMKPIIIKTITDNKGKIIEEKKSEEIRQVISEKTAKTIKSFMLGVVENGTGKTAKLPGIKIAGKTGTAQKPYPDRQGYSKTNVIASFVGFWPTDNPEFACLVLIDSPRNGHYGGTVAGPPFKNIVTRISNVPTRQQKIVWNSSQTSDKITFQNIRIPDVRNLSIGIAKRKLEKFDGIIEISGTGSTVISQNPLPGKYLKDGEKITLISAENPSKIEKIVTIPKLVGLSMRKAINNIHLKKLKFKVTYGNGTVVEQSPLPGKKVRPGSVCYIRCSDKENILKNLAYK